jgi:tRNA-specific 2-thiouridylase
VSAPGVEAVSVEASGVEAVSVEAVEAPKSGERVVIAMSGGVDSSLAAALAVERGCETIGVSMQLSSGSSRCCSLADVDDARRVADKLGVRFFVANYVEAFRREVIEAFADDYLAGRTPIPCVACNKRFKFDHLLERARVFGADRVATGHYARIDRDPETDRLRLLRARDRKKDQSYFLFQLDQSQLASAWFPLGELTKDEVRAQARALGLATAEKPESQEICFVPEGRYADVVEQIRPEARDRGGEFVDSLGRVLGRHSGVHHFTVGQRHGLGLSSSRKLYVSHIDAESGRVTVSGVEGLAACEAEIGDVYWVAGEMPVAPVYARVQVRHHHEGTLAKVAPSSSRGARVHFEEPVRAVAPGQAAVFYAADDSDVVLGGGWIAGAS